MIPAIKRALIPTALRHHRLGGLHEGLQIASTPQHRSFSILATAYVIPRVFNSSFTRTIRPKSSSSSSVQHVQSCLLQRTNDRQHRATYNRLQRIDRKYRKTNILTSKLDPTLDNLVVIFRKWNENSASLRHLNYKQNASLSSKPKPQELVEPLFFNAIISVLDIKLPPDVLLDQLVAIATHIQRMKLTVPSHNEVISAMNEIVENVGREFNIKQDVSNKDLLPRTLAYLMALYPEKPPSELADYIKVVLSPGIKASCNYIAQKPSSSIPMCILVDILSRSPSTKLELYLQLELWKSNHRAICYEYNASSNKLLRIFDNLIYYSAKFDPAQLPALVKYSLAAFQKSQRRHSKLLSQEYLNSLMWDIALYNQNSGINSSVPASIYVSQAQETIVKYFGSTNPGKQPYEFLLLKGYMAIVLGIAPLSSKKATVLFERATQKFINSEENGVPDSDSLIAYNFTSISLSEDPDTLMYRFNESANFWAHSGRIWTALIGKLGEFDLMNERRSVQILEQMLKQRDELIITRHSIIPLLNGIYTLHGLNDFIGTAIENCDEDSNGIYNLIKNASFSKYLKLLYRSAATNGSNGDQKRIFYGNLDKLYPCVRQEPLEKARELYKFWRQKTPTINGIHIFGESFFIPDKIYDVYVELVGSGNTELALRGLIRASMVTNKSSTTSDKANVGECLLWGDMYAPQVAIHEVNKYVMRFVDIERIEGINDTNSYMTSSYYNTEKLYPTDTFWKLYIAMLVKFEYIAELSDIMIWWEELGYMPDGEVLLQLLCGLPEGIGERHIRHFEKIRKESGNGETKRIGSGNDMTKNNREQWPWPTILELKSSRHR